MINTIPASDYCDRIFDGTHETPKPSEHGRPLVTSKNIVGGTLDKAAAYNISEGDYEGIQRRSYVSQWDVLFSMIGSVGEVYIEKSSEIDYAVKNVGVFSCLDESRAMWLYYYLKSATAKKIIRNHLNGAVQKFLSLGALRNFPVPAFDSNNEPAIHLLSTLDAKIELNQRINAELEGMAKLLYDYWFVQFDFPISAAQAAVMGKPHLEGKPYRSSGGKMTYHPGLKREIPKGWEVENILAVAELGGGATPSKKKAEFWNGKIPFFTPTDAESEPFCLDTEDHITLEGLSSSSTRLYGEGTLFITARGSVGKAMIISREMAMNQSCYALIPREGVGRAFLYFHTLSLMGFLRAKSSGSVFKSIVTNDIKFTPAIVPQSANLKEFSKFAEPVFNQILNNQKQNQELATLRDWLLPMLMNGQVTVGCSESASSRQKGEPT